MEEIIKKINYYTKISKERELSDDEKKDREKYRKLYIDLFKKQLKGHLDNIKITNNENLN